MITPKEYKKALEIVLQYKKQISKEVDNAIGKNVTLFDSGLSMRTLNAIYNNIHHTNIDVKYKNDITLYDISKIREYDLIRFRNLGAKGLKEINSKLIEYGFDRIK